MTVFDVELRFNGRVNGAQKWTGAYEAETVGDALEEVLSDVGRNIRKFGGAIFVTGVTVDERKP